MSQTEHVGEDASMDAAVAAIMQKMPSRLGKQEEPKDTRENRADRDVTEQDEYHDLHDLEALEKSEQAERARDGKEPAETKGDAEGEEGQEAQAEDDAFLELPPAEEGKEPERVPLKEAVEAVQKVRQMNEDIASAVIRAQDEEYAKQGKVTQELEATFKTVRNQAQIALKAMHAYAPQEPNPIMLDRNSGYYDPEAYHTAKIHYDDFVAHYQKVAATLKQAESGLTAVNGQQDSELVRRETERTARYIPEFKDEKTRAAKIDEIAAVLSKEYGIGKEDLADIVDHKAWRLLNDLAQMKAQKVKAPEVRKHIQETKPKIVNGRLPDRDKSSGRFIGDARKELRESGSEDSFAKLLMRSGALKGL